MIGLSDFSVGNQPDKQSGSMTDDPSEETSSEEGDERALEQAGTEAGVRSEPDGRGDDR